MTRAADSRRELLHRLVDELSSEAIGEALALISDFARADDGDLTETEGVALDEAEHAIAAGQVRPLAECGAGSASEVFRRRAPAGPLEAYPDRATQSQ